MLTDDHERGFGRVDGTSAAECENRIGIHVHHKFHGLGNKLDRRIGFDIREHGDLFAGGHVRFHRTAVPEDTINASVKSTALSLAMVLRTPKASFPKIISVFNLNRFIDGKILS